jgi:hypothetical protein
MYTIRLLYENAITKETYTMSTRQILKILLAVFVISLCSCAFQKFRTVIQEPVSGQSLKLPVLITRITFEDARVTVDNRDMKISRLALPGRKDEITPALSSEHREVLEKEIGKYVGNNRGEYKASCTIQILEGVKRYASSWSGEEMFVRSKIRVVLSDSLHTPYLASAIGEGEFSFQSNIANQMNFEILYQKAMRTALFKAVESIDGILKSIPSK